MLDQLARVGGLQCLRSGQLSPVDAHRKLDGRQRTRARQVGEVPTAGAARRQRSRHFERCVGSELELAKSVKCPQLVRKQLEQCERTCAEEVSVFNTRQPLSIITILAP